METGFDILFFWVARMAMLGVHFMGEVPFRTVLLHAMVRDEKGEKMSKTKGNVIDPLDVTARHGADALRFTLASMAGQGRDIKLSQDRIAGHRAFANKIWNAARFVLMNAEGYHPEAKPASVYDRWILSRYQRCADETRAALDEFRLSDAANGIYKFIWNELCDWAIELSKPALYGEKTPAERAGAQAALLTALEGALRLLHPFMPFVTEEIWQRLPNRQGPSIMIAPYPGARPELRDERAEREMDLVSRAIDGARSVNLPPIQRVPLVIFSKDPALFRRHERAFQHLANAAEVKLNDFGAPRPRGAAVHVEPEVEVHLPLAGLIDFAAEKVRVEKEIARADAEWEGIRRRLDNQGFVERAPKEVVEKDRTRAEELHGKREKLARHLARVTSVEDAMEDKKPQYPQGGESGQNHDRSLDQMGTHGGPAGPPHDLADRAREMVEAAREAVAPMTAKVADAMSGAREALASRAAEASEAVSEKAAQVRAAVKKRIAAARKPAKKAATKAKSAARKAAKPARKAAKSARKGAKKAAKAGRKAVKSARKAAKGKKKGKK
jgi:valyl-tRNA synthetase